MTAVFTWTGFIVLMGVMLAVGAGAWWYACTKILASMNETWWIVSWRFYKRRNLPDAKTALTKAIRLDDCGEQHQ